MVVTVSVAPPVVTVVVMTEEAVVEAEQPDQVVQGAAVAQELAVQPAEENGLVTCSNRLGAARRGWAGAGGAHRGAFAADTHAGTHACAAQPGPAEEESA